MVDAVDIAWTPYPDDPRIESLGGSIFRFHPPIASKPIESPDVERRETVPIEEPIAASGVGDLAAEFFATLGITPERYQAVKESLNLPDECGCDKRKRLLNALGEKLGINEAAAAMTAWLKGRQQAAS